MNYTLFGMLDTTSASGDTTTSPWITIVMVVLLVAAFYFLGIRPQRKQEKETAAMRNSLAIGDEITTIGGILGRVIKITDETVVIEVGKDRTKLHILKNAVRSIDVHANDTIEAAQKAEKAADK